jgi:hypothetical protein
MTCDPSALPPQVGRSCQTSEVCGCEGYECHPTRGRCVPVECNAPEECGPADADITCNTVTHRCVAGCDNSQTCPQGEFCGPYSVCSPACTPYQPDACESGLQCVPQDYEGAGYCLATATATEGMACEQSAFASGCAEGLICPSTTCVRPCDFFSSGETGCAADERCFTRVSIGSQRSYTGYCAADLEVDPAAPGQPCARASGYCADDGTRILGACDIEGICRELCHGLKGECDGAECKPFQIHDDAFDRENYAYRVQACVP